MLIENTILNLTEPATFSQRSKNLQGQAVEGGGGGKQKLAKIQ